MLPSSPAAVLLPGFAPAKPAIIAQFRSLGDNFTSLLQHLAPVRGSGVPSGPTIFQP
jgi:hypothetical protein